MKTMINLTNEEVRYLERRISSMPADTADRLKKALNLGDYNGPMGSETYRRNQDGSFTIDVDMNSDFLFDCVDTGVELGGKLVSIYHQVKGLFEAIGCDLDSFTSIAKSRFSKYITPEERKDRAGKKLMRFARHEFKRVPKDEHDYMFVYMTKDGNLGCHTDSRKTLAAIIEDAENDLKDNPEIEFYLIVEKFATGLNLRDLTLEDAKTLLLKSREAAGSKIDTPTTAASMACKDDIIDEVDNTAKGVVDEAK